MDCAKKLGILVPTKFGLRVQLYLDVRFEDKGVNKNTMVKKDSQLILHTCDLIHTKYDNNIGTAEVEKIFGKKIFDFPKPTSLIKDLVALASNENSIILDFFAGSGTTGHAIENLNNEVGGKRQFILVTNNENDICKSVTYPRLKKTIKNNLIFYKTLLVPHSTKPTDNDRQLLSLHAGELIGLKEQTYETVEINNYYHVLTNPSKTKCTLIYFNEDLYK
jgi:adenine-specific DNA-methyltransferase